MSKRTRSLLITAVALLAVIGLLAVTLLLPEKAQDAGSDPSSVPQQPSVTLIDKSADANGNKIERPIERIDIALPDETFSVQWNQTDGLRVTAYADLAPNAVKLGTLVASLATVTATRLVKAEVQDMSVYGFDGQACAVSVTYHDGTVYAFELGAESPGEAGRYLREKDGNDVYLASAYFAATVTAPSTTYISPSLIKMPATGGEGVAVLRNMELSGALRPQAISLRRALASDPKALRYTGYLITAPVVRGMEGTAAKEISSVLSLTAAAVVCPHPTAQQLQQYGLDDPFSVARYDLAVLVSKTSADGEQKEEYYHNAQSHTVRLGNKDDNGNYYALVDGIDMVVTLTPSAVPWAEATFDTLVDPQLFMEMITDVQRLSLTTAQGTFDFVLTHLPDETDRNKNLTVTCGGQSYGAADMRKLYQVLMKITRVGPAEGAVPEDDPVLTVELTPVAGSQGSHVKAQLYKISGSRYLCKQANGDTYQVTARTVDHALGQIENYLSGQAVTL